MDVTEFFGTGPEFHYTNTREGLSRACAQASLQSRVARRKARVGEIVLLCIVGVGAVRSVAEMYPPGIVIGSILLLIWTLAAVGSVALFRFMTRRGASLNLHLLADQGLFDGQTGKHRMVLTPQGVVEQNDRGVVLIRWPYITGIESTPEHTKVLSGPGWFFLLPKNAFVDEEAAQAFEAAIRLRMQEGTEPRPQA